MTHDIWHVTRDTWHVTHDTWDVWGGWTFSQNFRSLALTVWDLGYYEDLEEKDEWINQLINHEAVYRTAPATPGLLNISSYQQYVRYGNLQCLVWLETYLCGHLTVIVARVLQGEVGQLQLGLLLSHQLLIVLVPLVAQHLQVQVKLTPGPSLGPSNQLSTSKLSPSHSNMTLPPKLHSAGAGCLVMTRLPFSGLRKIFLLVVQSSSFSLVT